MKGKKQLQDDSLTQKVIDEVARELKMNPDKVRQAVQHFFQWQRKAFNEMKHKMYLWNYFGTFSMIESRYEKYINSGRYKRYLEKLTKEESINSKINNKDEKSKSKKDKNKKI